MTRLPKLFTVTASVALSMLFASCGGSSLSSKGATSTNYRIYSITDLSGSNAANSGKSAPGVTAYIDMINKQGGVHGHQIQLTTLDSQTSTDGAIAAFQRAVAANPLAIITGSVSSETVAAAPAALRAGIPVLAPGGLPDDWYYPPKADVFGVSQSGYVSAALALKQVHYMAQKSGISQPRIAVDCLVSSFGDSMISAFHALAPKYNIKIVEQSRTPISATSFSGTAAKIAAANANYVVGEEIPAIVPAVMTALGQAGVTAPFINFFIPDTPQLFDAVRNPNYYAMQVANPPDTPGTQMAAAAKAAGVANQLTSQFFTLGWWSAEVAVDALKKCPSDCSRSNYLKLLNSTKINLAPEGIGVVKFTPQIHVLLTEGQAHHWTPSGIVPAGPVFNVTSTPHV